MDVLSACRRISIHLSMRNWRITLPSTRTGSRSSHGSSWALSQSRRSKLPPHSRQTMNSCSNLSNGPQSRPCVSTELAIRYSPNDEPQSGQAIARYPLLFNHLQPDRSRSGRGSEFVTPTLFGAILEMTLD